MSGRLLMLCQGLGRFTPNFLRVRAAARIASPAGNSGGSSLRATRANSSSVQGTPQPSAKLPFEVDTNVAKPTEIYRFDKFNVFGALRVFTVTQMFLWAYMAHVCYTITDPRNAPPPDLNTSGRVGGLLQFLRDRLTTDPYRYGLTAFCVAIGTLVVTSSSIFLLRSVRSIVLLKGGQQVFVQTYAPFVELRAFEVPLEHISCRQSRLQKSSYISLKIKGHRLYYMLDQRGIFPHPKLFDNTVGVARKLK
ncbi:transmembrane protein 223-like [Dermacentor silvarum]|uniref:transmembrane protein 223-like n=1 Tax=Dermacentor silvarum TaxID=543639 RepID=UPI0018972091|nr:transmembrane protein 223-like [Dermacentor silvarum]